MGNPKSLIVAIIAFAVAIRGGAIGLMGVIETVFELVVIAFIIVITIGLIFLSYNELNEIEKIEIQEEAVRQRERDKVQLEILNTLRELGQLLSNETSSPNPTRIEFSDDSEDDDNNLLSSDDSGESQSNQ